MNIRSASTFGTGPMHTQHNFVHLYEKKPNKNRRAVSYYVGLIERNHSKSGATEPGSPLFTHRWDGKYSGWHLREVSVLREPSGSGGSDEFVWQMLLEYVLSTVLRRGPGLGFESDWSQAKHARSLIAQFKTKVPGSLSFEMERRAIA